LWDGYFNATVQENGFLAGVGFTVNGTAYIPTALGGSRFSVTVARFSSYDVRILASDGAGHSTEFHFAVTFNG